jgi:outer membrane beta-barrel protein
MRTWLRLVLAITVCGTTLAARAEKMAFPENELARETVLPVFDVPNSVRNRNVEVAGKFELGGFMGSVSDEAVFKQNQYGLVGTYHFNEIHGVNLTVGMMPSGVGTYADSLKEATSSTARPLDLTHAFGPKSYILANYQLTGFYGKMSILKNLVVNTHIYGMLGLGTVNYDGMNALALDFGLGQRFYILKNLALRFDLKFVRFTGPNPIVVPSKNADLAAGRLKITDFETTNYLMTNITGGLVFLF